jgi:hypothetical protein
VSTARKSRTFRNNEVVFSGNEDPDVLELADHTIVGKNAGANGRADLIRATTEIRNKHGERAFECPKSAAANHEAGHVVIHAAMGGRVRYANIRRIGDKWVGYTEFRAGRWGGHDATAEEILNKARDIFAGVAAESMFEEDFREGSSLSEVIMSQYFAAQSWHRKDETLDQKAYWTTEVVLWSYDTLKKHRVIHAQIAEHLMQHECIKGADLNALCNQIRLSAA